MCPGWAGPGRYLGLPSLSVSLLTTFSTLSNHFLLYTPTMEDNFSLLQGRQSVVKIGGGANAEEVWATGVPQQGELLVRKLKDIT